MDIPQMELHLFKTDIQVLISNWIKKKKETNLSKRED